MSPSTAEAGPVLNLDLALRLLAQSGRALPDAAHVGRIGWLQSLVDGLCELSSRDALTGLANRRQFEVTWRARSTASPGPASRRS